MIHSAGGGSWWNTKWNWCNPIDYPLDSKSHLVHFSCDGNLLFLFFNLVSVTLTVQDTFCGFCTYLHSKGHTTSTVTVTVLQESDCSFSFFAVVKVLNELSYLHIAHIEKYLVHLKINKSKLPCSNREEKEIHWKFFYQSFLLVCYLQHVRFIDLFFTWLISLKAGLLISLLTDGVSDVS